MVPAAAGRVEKDGTTRSRSAQHLAERRGGPVRGYTKRQVR
jgi:hypothetical protein